MQIYYHRHSSIVEVAVKRVLRVRPMRLNEALTIACKREIFPRSFFHNIRLSCSMFRSVLDNYPLRSMSCISQQFFVPLIFFMHFKLFSCASCCRVSGPEKAWLFWPWCKSRFCAAKWDTKTFIGARRSSVQQSLRQRRAFWSWILAPYYLTLHTSCVAIYKSA